MDQIIGENLREIGVLAEVLGLKLVGVDIGVGAPQVAWLRAKWLSADRISIPS